MRRPHVDGSRLRLEDGIANDVFRNARDMIQGCVRVVWNEVINDCLSNRDVLMSGDAS